MAYRPDYAIMTNIDLTTQIIIRISMMQSAFEAFGKQVKKGIIACGDDERLRTLEAIVPVTYYGVGEHNDVITKTSAKRKQEVILMLIFTVNYMVILHSSYGDHNILNALAIIAFYYLNQLDPNELAQQFRKFSGVKRRFSEKVINGVTVIDDYAPTHLRFVLH